MGIVNTSSNTFRGRLLQLILISVSLDIIIYIRKILLDRRQRGTIRSVLLVIIGWLVGWQRSFLRNGSEGFSDFVVWRLGTIKVEKSQSRIFEKNSWFGDIREKISKLAQNQTLIFFSKTALTIFFGFCPEVSTKYDLQFEWNLFFRKILNFQIFGPEIVKKLPKLRFFAIFST